MVSFEEIEEIFNKLEGKLTHDEFISRVDKKILEMNGLCNSKTAASLVASELGFNEILKIKDIKTEKSTVIFIAKVISIGTIREFSRGTDTMGRVVNLNLADDTGTIKAALWDEAADLVKIGDIKIGHTIKVKGYTKQGQLGLEVNVGRGGNIEHVEKDVSVCFKSYKIKEVRAGMSGINVLGKVLDIGKIRTFERKDGKMGKVTNITIGDDTGKIRVTLWDAKAESPGVNAGDVVEVMNAYARENTFTGSPELQLGSNGSVVKSKAVVDYSEPLTQIGDIGINAAYSISGHVSGIDEIREFERQDGTRSRVSSIYISDNTGRIKVVLWGEHAELINEMDIGSEIRIVDAYARAGRNEEVELSAGARTGIQIIRK